MSNSDAEHRYRITRSGIRHRQKRLPINHRHFGRVLEIWKTTVQVQQHFNDLQLRLRNYAVTITGAFLGASALTAKEQVGVPVHGWFVPLAALLLLAAAGTLAAFWFMDYRYHQLLLGAVQHGRSIEDKWKDAFPEIGLATAIGGAIPVLRPWAKEFHSSRETDIHLVYGVAIVGLVVAAFVLASLHLTVPSATVSSNVGSTHTAPTVQSGKISPTAVSVP